MENSPRSHIVYIWTLDIHVAKVLLFGKNVEKIHQKNFVSLCILRITVILLLYLGHPTSFSLRQAVTERCRLSWLTTPLWSRRLHSLHQDQTRAEGREVEDQSGYQAKEWWREIHFESNMADYGRWQQHPWEWEGVVQAHVGAGGQWIQEGRQQRQGKCGRLGGGVQRRRRGGYGVTLTPWDCGSPPSPF